VLKEEIIEQFRQLPSAYVTDAMGRMGVAGWPEGVFPLSSKACRFAGRSVTVKYGPKRGGTGKRPSIMEAIRNCKRGDVLVIAAGSTPCWILGGNLASAAMIEGVAAIVVDGCVRDVDEIAEMKMPVFCRGGGTRPFSTHLELSDYNVPVEFAGAQIRPDDIVVGDSDGLVIVPGDQAEDILFQAGDIGDYERETQAAIERRASLSDLGAIISRKHLPRKQ
jgi:4-hydroxy-4-methyl-2-oxoglutarate aldolase